MEPSKVLVSNIDDIVFEHRNKTYGAYVLRAVYESHVRKSMLAGGLLFTLAITSPSLINKFFPDGFTRKKEVKVEVQLEEPPPLDPNKPLPPPPPPPPPTPPPPAATVKYVPPIVKKDEEVPEEAPPPKQEELKDVQVSTKTQEGTKNVPVNVVEEVAAAPPAPEVIEEKKKEPEIFSVVEQMPTFPDGDLALMKYLQANIKYPALARENGIQGKSIIQFVVDEEGNISQEKVARGIGGGCDEEALRVVSGMPKWKPGRQRGKAVKVRFTLPVQFRLE